eukprot:CAMPEP_0194484834 /NCGR_PEP_ID=MMETSP0253-20130528/6040_1 /TAXON_ID=2966 /ORGANISM="Noctiluca scintillans" /LENGTH=126 /DNA_ID=CAMNT_0039324707 /DNA_START=1051 /DNA_END=1431 /DNA_ORIENTATION=+
MGPHEDLEHARVCRPQTSEKVCRSSLREELGIATVTPGVRELRSHRKPRTHYFEGLRFLPVADQSFLNVAQMEFLPSFPQKRPVLFTHEIPRVGLPLEDHDSVWYGETKSSSEPPLLNTTVPPAPQ